MKPVAVARDGRAVVRRPRRGVKDGFDYAEITRRFRSGESLTRIWLEHCAAPFDQRSGPAGKIPYRLFASRRAQHEKTSLRQAQNSETIVGALAQFAKSATSAPPATLPLDGAELAPPFIVIEVPGTALQIRKGSLCVRMSDGTESLFPPRRHKLQSIAFAASGASITGDAISWLVAEGVNLSLCERGEALAMFAVAPETQISVSHISARRDQFAALGDPVRTTAIARAVVAAKIAASQIPSPDAATMLAKASSVAEVMAAEAIHARAYWRNFAASAKIAFDKKSDVPAAWINFTMRGERKSNRYAATPLAAMQNYAYSVTLNRIIAQLIARGFDPAFGFLHSESHGRASLAYDALELLRPDIDRAVIALCARNIFARSDFPIEDMSGRLTVRCGRSVARALVKAVSRLDVKSAAQSLAALIRSSPCQKSERISNSSREMSKI